MHHASAAQATLLQAVANGPDFRWWRHAELGRAAVPDLLQRHSHAIVPRQAGGPKRLTLNQIAVGPCFFKQPQRVSDAIGVDHVAPYDAVTTTALHSLPPLRRYACGVVASK